METGSGSVAHVEAAFIVKSSAGAARVLPVTGIVLIGHSSCAALGRTSRNSSNWTICWDCWAPFSGLVPS